MPNPFFFAGKIANIDQFVGREQELKKIFGYLNTDPTGQIQHVSVVGERRIGKSSLLYHINQVYKQNLLQHEKYRFVYVDLDKPHCHTQTGLLRFLLEQLNLPVPKKLSLELFYESIEQEHEKAELWPVFLFDEFEHLPQRKAEFPDGFYETLRSLGNNNIAGLVTASQHSLQGLAEQGKLTSPFFNIFHQLDLKEFNEREAGTLLERGRRCDRPFSQADCKEILKIADRYPARLQLVASLAYEAKANGAMPDWKAIKTESIKQAPFINNGNKAINKTNWLVAPFKWLFWHAPQYLGHTILVVIGRGEQTNETTDRLIGYLALILVFGLLAGLIPWPLVTKLINRLSQLFFQ
ncbi:MAG: ATP-binding protein [Chloroflexota bacterium]